MRHSPDCGRELLGPPLDPLLVSVEWCGMVWNGMEWYEVVYRRFRRSAPFLRYLARHAPLPPLPKISSPAHVPALSHPHIQPVVGSSGLEAVFKYKPRTELGTIASRLHW